MKSIKLLSLMLLIVPRLVLAQVTINEIMYDLEGTDTGREWVEVHNLDTASIVSSIFINYKFREDGINHGLKAVSSDAVPAGGYAIIADDASKFYADHPNFTGVIFESSFSLENTGGELAIMDESLTQVDSYTYSSDTGAKGTGESLQKIGSVWQASAPTPGVANELNELPDDDDDDSDDSSDSDDQDDSSSGSSSGRSSALSSHSSVAELSSFKLSSTLKSSAGRERLAAVYSPVTFKAQVPEVFKNSKTKFTWVFGDGGSAKGATTRHAYEAPGNYQVVLNAVSGEEEAPSRTKVKVFSPDIKLGYNLVGGKLMLALVNRGADELNIGGWQLSNMGQGFTFPEDTIIAGKAEIALSPGIIGFTSNQLFPTQFFYPNALVATEILPNNSLNRQEITKMINELKERVAKMRL